MTFGFANVQHFVASAFSDLHKALTFVEKEVPVLQKAEPIVEGVTAVALGAASPVVTIERAAFSALGVIVAAATAADAATAAKGISIPLDAAAVAAYKALVAEFKTELTSLGYNL